MAKIIVLGAGISGHTAATILKQKLGNKHEVIVVSPNKSYQWVPSNIWVGVGAMSEDQVKFDLAPVYKKMKILHHQAKAVAIYPEGNQNHNNPFVKLVYTDPQKVGQEAELEYDYCINATGPKLNFEATEGLGPELFSNSVCTFGHASQSWKELQVCFKLMEQGKKQRLLIGIGHPTATCQGAAFEYALNVANLIRHRQLEKMAEIIWITNEFELGDFGMGGAFVKRGGYVTSSKIFTESILAEHGIRWIKQAGIKKVEQGKAYYETLDGENHEIEFDFAMLIPAFSGVGLKAFNKANEEISTSVFAPSGFLKVDADYTPKSFEEWGTDDWPSIYKSPLYDNLFATGIAFAPPHPISKPVKSKNGTLIAPTPPRTGMPSGVTGKIVALNIVEEIKSGKKQYRHKASMGRMGAACIISVGYGLTKGMAATMTVFPIVPDWKKYPEWGRDISYTVGEPGLAGHWIKLLLHYMFLYKAKCKPFWWLIPE
jgi:sulfide:quinone oxidoreductase